MVFQALKQISKRELCSKNYLQAMATLLFNFSVVCL